MSRGPGRWQRIILSEVEKGEWVYLVDLLPDGYTVSQYNALQRAARTLVGAGKIGWFHYVYGLKKVVVGRPGQGRPGQRPEPLGSTTRMPCLRTWSRGIRLRCWTVTRADTPLVDLRNLASKRNGTGGWLVECPRCHDWGPRLLATDGGLEEATLASRAGSRQSASIRGNTNGRGWDQLGPCDAPAWCVARSLTLL